MLLCLGIFVYVCFVSVSGFDGCWLVWVDRSGWIELVVVVFGGYWMGVWFLLDNMCIFYWGFFYGSLVGGWVFLYDCICGVLRVLIEEVYIFVWLIFICDGCGFVFNLNWE